MYHQAERRWLIRNVGFFPLTKPERSIFVLKLIQCAGQRLSQSHCARLATLLLWGQLSANDFSYYCVFEVKREKALVLHQVFGRGLNLLTPLLTKPFLNPAGFNPQSNYSGLFESVPCVPLLPRSSKATADPTPRRQPGTTRGLVAPGLRKQCQGLVRGSH